MGQVKLRNVKYCIPQCQEMKDFWRDWHNALIEANKYLYNFLISKPDMWQQIKESKGSLIQRLTDKGCTKKEIKDVADKYRVEGGYMLPKTVWEDVQKILVKYGFIKDNQYHLNSLVNYILDQYKGAMKRHKNGVKIKQFNRHKAVRLNKNLVVDNTPTNMSGTLNIRGYKSKEGIKVPYPEVYSSQYNKSLVTPKNLAGNLKLVNDKYIHVTKVEIPLNPFDPISSIGFDINASVLDFLTFSDGTQIAQPQEAIDIIAKIAECTKKRNDKTILSKERRPYQILAKKLHNKLAKIYKPIAQGIIGDCIANKLALCIDGAAPGSNTFGADQIRKLLIQLCEDNNVPFCVVNPAYTSRTCSTCYIRHDKKTTSGFGRLSTGIFKCGNKYCKDYDITKDAQKNAAININNDGKQYLVSKGYKITW